MNQTQSLRKKNAADNNSAQPLQRNRAKNDSETLDKKTDSAAEQDNAPLQKKAYRAAQDEPRLQTKLSVSTPGDSHEQEADRVADEVVSRSAAASTKEENKLSPGNTKPENNASNPQSLQTKISRMTEPAPATTEAPQTETEISTPTETATDNEQGVSAEVEQQIAGLRGQGAQLSEQVRTELESQFNHDFSSVSIHTDGTADALCKQLSARAFTVGSDIFFASGEYAPDSQEGKRLLAHELTHVVQQGSGVTRKIMRDAATDVPTSAGDISGGLVDRTNHTITYNSVNIPAFKADSHRGVKYGLWKLNSGLRRHHEYSGESRVNDQISVWETGIEKEGIVNALRAKTSPSFLPINGQYAFQNGSRREYYVGTLEQIAASICRPQWNKRGNPERMQVDHIVELQLTGTPNGSTGNIIENMELLKGAVNASSGSTIGMRIASLVNSTYRNSVTKPLLDAEFTGAGLTSYSDSQWLARAIQIQRRFDIIFNDFAGSGGPSVTDNDYWSEAEIEAGDHVDPLREAGLENLAGTGQVMVFKSPTGGEGDLFSWDGSTTAPANSRERNWLYPWRIEEKHFSTQPDDVSNGNLGRFVLALPANSATSSMRATLDVNRFQNQRNVGGIDLSSSAARQLGRELRANHFSPIELDLIEPRAEGLFAEGRVIPDIPFLRDCNLDLLIDDGEIKISKTFSSGNINVPSPFSLDNCSLAVFLSSRRGLGIEGRVDFGIERVGSGYIGAAASVNEGFALQGQFNFDDRIFGEGTNAQVRMGYANDQWSMGGTITIPEGKVPGISTATIDVDYSEASGFSARGNATLNVPGVESGTIEITHNEEEGFVIGGSFNLSQGRGIRGGQISARVQERPDGTGYAVTAHGEAQPDIPGINSNLIVDYNDGAFTAEVSADYSRGMLSGRVNAGVTNRTVNDDGSLSETAAEGNPLVIYGGGQLTLQIAPWLQGTAGVQFAPNGEVTVTGEIGLPSQLEIFARREINKSIFSIAVQAPIFPGIVAEVGGGLSATAGIGPGVIDQLRLGITYNPAHEEETRITGDAHLNIPANAGLRLSVRAGIGLGITGASATGGLDIGGTLGIEGAAEAGVHVEWTPATGLDIQTELAVHAQPSFTFDIGGYVSVRALGFEVYDNRWEFASYTFGSDYRFGIRLPIHYHEGEPFDISLDDVQFEVPDIDTDQLLSGLIERIA